MSTELNMILYEEMIESMQEGIIIINAKGTVIRMNDAAMRLLGVDCSAVGVPYALLMVEDTNNDDFHEIVLGAIYERKKISGQIVKLAGDEIWVSVTASYLNNEAGKAVVIVMEDLTGISELRDARIALNKIRKLNEELEGAKNEAIEANNAKSRFISNVSHEIRTPINAVLGMNEMILRETQEEQILQYANNIQNAGKTLHFLINDILDMSKIEAGRMELTESEYELDRLLQELWGLIYLRAQEKGLAIYFIIDKKTPLHLYGDDIRIKQILTNILTNAVKYTPKGEVKLTLEYQKKDDDMIELIVAVSDTGIGIREEDKAAVFESFRRVDAHKNKSIEGTGLGMNITMSLLDLMNGSLQMESVYQQGSTFTVRIPQKVCGIETIGEFDVQKLNINGRSEKENRTTIYAPDGKVLVVDDNPLNLEVAKGLLKRTGVQVATAESGKKALEMVEKDTYHLILMDHQMPEMDGIETLQELKKKKCFYEKKIPVVMLTANAVSNLCKIYQEAGFDDVLTKPIEPAKLEMIIAKSLPENLLQDIPVNHEENQEKCLPKDALETDKAELLKRYGVDFQKGLLHLRGDTNVYSELATMFITQSDKALEQLETFLALKKTEEYKICVHGLKGNAATLGAEKLAECALKHEQNAKEQNIEYLQENFGMLKAEIERVQEAFKSITVRNEKQEIEAKWSAVNKWFNELQQVRECLEDFNADKAMEILDKLLKEKSWLCWENELELVKSAVENEYDDEKAIAVLENLTKGDEKWIFLKEQ